MQYNKSITIKYVTGYNDYSEPEGTANTILRVAVLKDFKRIKKTEQGRRNQYDLAIAIKHRIYQPYADVFENNEITVTYEGKAYDVMGINRVGAINGRPRYYEISLNQAVTGNEN